MTDKMTLEGLIKLLREKGDWFHVDEIDEIIGQNRESLEAGMKPKLRFTEMIHMSPPHTFWALCDENGDPIKCEATHDFLLDSTSKPRLKELGIALDTTAEFIEDGSDD